MHIVCSIHFAMMWYHRIVKSNHTHLRKHGGSTFESGTEANNHKILMKLYRKELFSSQTTDCLTANYSEFWLHTLRKPYYIISCHWKRWRNGVFACFHCEFTEMVVTRTKRKATCHMPNTVGSFFIRSFRCMHSSVSVMLKVNLNGYYVIMTLNLNGLHRVRLIVQEHTCPNPVQPMPVSRQGLFMR